MIKWGKGFMEKRYLGAIVEVRGSVRKPMRGLMPEGGLADNSLEAFLEPHFEE